MLRSVYTYTNAYRYACRSNATSSTSTCTRLLKPSFGRFFSAVPLDPPSSGDSELGVSTVGSSNTNTSTTNSASGNAEDLSKYLRPSEIVTKLDDYVVGQQDAKRAVAIALRNRWRRRLLPEDIKREIMPKNVLLVGPTGCGKTEVARRMAMLNDAPFIKVEATKFTEVGYHGRDVDKIISDLMDISLQLTRKRHTEIMREQARANVEERILAILTGTSTTSTPTGTNDTTTADRTTDSFREMMKDGMLDDQPIEIDVPQKTPSEMNIGTTSTGGDVTMPIPPQIMAMIMSQGAAAGGGKKIPTDKKKTTVAEARELLLDSEIDKLLANVDLKKEAIAAVEETGIVFIDEIDKICTSNDSFGKSADASAEGVQRDLLPLVEGTTISTKHGNVKTDYILFVASGAFHAVKPSDLLPELQGRLPVRVELKGLTERDLYRILTEPVANMIRQQVELLKTEGVELVFEDEAILEIASMAAELNKSVENIGARRLHTVMERIMEEISFEAAEVDAGTKFVVDKQLVQERLKDVTMKTDLTRFIL
ncbi:ATPase subunit HslU [Seminavis robusta]|uniref:ATPase subunit HslU n=1 Tax=Seminavis robusta TaxID=568900 RepID=A0A9N8DGT7_9STRA|nr:ATPase subunit HslU [Seminavis robusta]|eukprot:Sro60_g034670.1 ATPase subunit HslU (539) ;mRNA; f:67662-69741